MTDNSTDIETRQRDLDTAKASLAEFEKEAAGIPAEIRAAVEAENAPLGITLRQRYDAVPTYIHAARLLVARRSVSLMEAKLAEAESSFAVAAEEEVRVTAAWQKAQLRMEEAIGATGGGQYVVNSCRIALQDQKRALEMLLAESAQPPGLAVRSIWQQAG